MDFGAGEPGGLLLVRGYEAEERDGWGYFRHHYPPLSRPWSVAFEIHYRMGMGEVVRAPVEGGRVMGAGKA